MRLAHAASLLAALLHLWLGVAHAAVGADGHSFCGGGSPALRAQLLRQLPPELRPAVDPLGINNSGATCDLCATAHAPALASTPPRIPLAIGYEAETPAAGAGLSLQHFPHRPYSRGPPDIRS